MQSQLRRRLLKAASELGLHYFLCFLAHGIGLQILLIYSTLCFLETRMILNVKVVPKDIAKELSDIQFSVTEMHDIIPNN